jgi:hypothetical protein
MTITLHCGAQNLTQQSSNVRVSFVRRRSWIVEQVPERQHGIALTIRIDVRAAVHGKASLSFGFGFRDAFVFVLG